MVFETFISYLGNEYVRAGLIFGFVLIVLRPLLFSLEKLVLAFTGRTKTDLDDKLVKRLYRPTAYILVLVGLVISVQELSLPLHVHGILRQIAYTLMLLALAQAVYAVFDVVFVQFVRAHTDKSEDATRKSLSNLLLSILRIIIILFSVLAFLSLWGFEVGPYLAGLGIAGLAVALALQPTLANIFSGAGVILDHAFKEGDFIIINDTTSGVVQKVGLRSTKLLTLDNELVVLPNSTIANAKIVNQSMPDVTVRAMVSFNVAHGVDIGKLEKKVLAALAGVDHILKAPAPRLHFNAIKDFGCEVFVYFTVDSYSRKAETVAAANTALYGALSKDFLRKI